MTQSTLDQKEMRYRRIAITIVMMGVMMSAVDTTAVVLALPVIIVDLNSNIITMVWVLLAYLLVIAILGTQVGRLGDMFGRVRMYNIGFGVFTFGSLLCGIATNGSMFIGFRVLQGVGGALISSNSGAIVADTFPQKERGKAFGITGMGFSIGAILGILVGGAFVTFLSWRYIFFIDLPIGIVATIAGYYLFQDRSPRKKEKLDIGGYLSVGFQSFPFALLDHEHNRFRIDDGILNRTAPGDHRFGRVHHLGTSNLGTVPRPFTFP